MAKKVKIKSEHKHRDCIFAVDWHDVGYDGNPILCKCKFEQWNLLLNDPACKTNFKQK